MIVSVPPNAVALLFVTFSTPPVAAGVTSPATVCDCPFIWYVAVCATPAFPIVRTVDAGIPFDVPSTRFPCSRNVFPHMFVVDVDDSYHNRAERVRVSIDQDNLEFYRVEQADVYDTLNALYAGRTVGYSHRGGGRQPIPIRIALTKSDSMVNERMMTTPVPANALPGGRDVVELGDVVSVSREPASWPIFRHNGRPAEMVMAELAGRGVAASYHAVWDFFAHEGVTFKKKPARRRAGSTGRSQETGPLETSPGEA